MIDRLFALRDPEFRDFQRKLIPNLDPERIIGIRTPQLRKLSKQVDPDFRKNLPHTYFEENQIHAFSLEKMEDFEKLMDEVEAFLPFVDNWATCDQLRPKLFAFSQDRLIPYIRRWLQSDHPYTVRFAIEMLMLHYLDGHFDPAYPALVASVRLEGYYVRMMQAWYFATALAVRYVDILPFLTEHRLPVWVHNKTIQKAVESYRISDRQKQELKTLRIK